MGDLIPLKARRIIWGHYDLKDIFPSTKEGKFEKLISLNEQVERTAAISRPRSRYYDLTFCIFFVVRTSFENKGKRQLLNGPLEEKVWISKGLGL